jgi:GNAT superfamily N-acetyltransferase
MGSSEPAHTIGDNSANQASTVGIHLIEELAANAWPALVVELVDGWLLRFTPGARIRRANSVLPINGRGEIPLEERFRLVEAFYSRREVPVRYQVSPAAIPGDLDAALERRGYVIEVRVDVMVAEVAGMVGAADASELGPARVAAEPEPRWLDTWTQVSDRGGTETLWRLIVDRIACPVAFASIEVGGRVAAVGMGVAERGWLGVFSMGTVPEFRRRGAARAVLFALAQWGAEHGTTRAYLQTEAGNEPAIRLYGTVGFSRAYGYHYRTLDGFLD